jgi:magnesium-transporting ATPase (P-type)
MIKKEHINLLRENEKIMMTLHRHWIILLAHFAQLLVLMGVSAFVFYYQEHIMSITGGALYWGGLSLFWISYLTFMLLNWMNDELDIFIITDSRIIGVEQLSALSRNVSECELGRVQEVNAHVGGIWQTLFNF